MKLCEVKLLMVGDHLDNLKCDNVVVPEELRSLGMTDQMLGDLLHTIGDDFIDGTIERTEEM